MRPLCKSAHEAWQEHLLAFGFPHVVDATCGNGKDSSFLCTQKIGHLFCYDIQEKALRTTRALLPKGAPATFFCRCHSDFAPLENIALFVYNLGYLPGGDKTVITRTKTTIQSLESAAARLLLGGMISLCCYPGHEGGFDETKAVQEWISQSSFEIHCHESTKRSNGPILYLLKKNISR